MRWAIAAFFLLSMGGAASAQDKFKGIGRAATVAEIKAWDIDVRADFTGLPPGSGSVQQGEKVWESQCTSCHGAFGEANHVFAPIVGGTTNKDIATGRVALLAKPNDGRTTLMKLSSVSTLWDYINRAMPWNAPKTLTHDEVYAVTAFILNLGDIVPGDFSLSDKNIAAVQARLPNRNGVTQKHGLWGVAGTPDVRNAACMKNCPVEARVMSFLPDYARDAHGNIAEQNRLTGGVRGVDTTRLAGSSAKQIAQAEPSDEGHDLAKKHACTVCHGLNNALVGPSMRDIAGKYKGDKDAETRLLAKLKTGGAGTWGSIPMPPQAHIQESDLQRAVQWILGGAK
ncbi:MAG: c-type cytochrome [Betaproteobacteria bacterium]|nr:c-type cytochrome [Betaproteobacteria bacterium]